MDFLYNILNIVLFVVMLGVLVTIHELGHFLVAKMFKVYVFEFSIGFGPKLFRKKKGETYYSMRALPLGGYVSMLGEENVVPEELEGVEIPRERSLVGINRGKRAAIMSAGIVMNLVLGFFIFLFSNGVLTQNRLYTTLIINENSVLHSYGVVDGDRLKFEELTIDGYHIQSFGDGVYTDAEDVETLVYVMFSPKSYSDLEFGGKSINLLKKSDTTLTNNSFYTDFKAGGKLVFDATFLHAEKVDEEIVTTEMVKTITLNTVSDNDTFVLGTLGASFTLKKERNNFVQTFKATGQDFVSSLTAVARGIKSLFTSGLANVSGPIGIFNVSASTLQNQGFGSFLYLWGLISINLALFNLLPFPPLDGWHLLVVIIESITRQEISPKFKNVASMIGAVLLIILTIAVLAKDVIGLFGVLL